MEDVAQISDDVTIEKSPTPDQTKSLSSNESNNRSMSQQLVIPQSDQEKLEFGKAVLLLPKNDLKKEWEKLQKYMMIFLEDYKEPAKSEEPPKE